LFRLEKKIDLETIGNKIALEISPQSWEKNEPIDLDTLYDCYIPTKLQIDTRYDDLGKLGIPNAFGCTRIVDGVKESIVDKSITYVAKEKERRHGRSTIAHESGHCILHMNLTDFHSIYYSLGINLFRERSSIPAYSDPEWQAWYLAAAITMPYSLVENIINNYRNEEMILRIMVTQFDVNYSWAARRLKDIQKNLTRPIISGAGQMPTPNGVGTIGG
jgi:hypothetical protein